MITQALGHLDSSFMWIWEAKICLISSSLSVIAKQKDIIQVGEGNGREKVAFSELGHESYGGQAQGRRRFHWIGLDCGLNYSWNLILKLLSSNYSGHAGSKKGVESWGTSEGYHIPLNPMQDFILEMQQ